jgi:hypothetical protein
MDIEQVRDFFFWCMVVNTVVYTITAIAVLALRDLVSGIQTRLFNLDEKTISTATHKYLATYKLLITVFNFTPWVALLIIG